VRRISFVLVSRGIHVAARSQDRTAGRDRRPELIDNSGDWDSTRAPRGACKVEHRKAIDIPVDRSDSGELELVKRSKGTRGMPRRGQARKDAASCDKPWLGARIL
jgi:hypothetical protein